ncbi:hypothetical protein NSK_006522 [Nannochloropsis salina CCMP1776]|uniref:DUF676 domain-containing protein n=1 Tax=Nannochloropsis salina CCMP1776 TaxID=1027361 RepID=A0A4D9CXB7_9STRA|nr:hypothetical protein NSK_006522 [Nannochloropsis salina CCMP1776]|eukprot:TFJ82193.1 hypothetical protein NSK_006522 [Nannochloropsis salina CCMP1776]
MPSAESFAAPASPASSTSIPVNSVPEPTHLAVVVHGLHGRPADLTYLGNAIGSRGQGRILPHLAHCNLHKTMDGVVKGGERLAAEIKEVVAAHPSLRAISFIGNSLGGVYSRYALSLLWEPRTRTVLGLKPITFMSIATPHLGVRRFTVVPVPDLVHVATPLFIGQTGNDLILRSRGEGETPLLLEMAQSTKFLEPLAAFRHRCAYGNVKEDLLVPIGTALFHPGPESMEGTGHILKETVVLPDGAREDVRMEVFAMPPAPWEDGLKDVEGVVQGASPVMKERADGRGRLASVPAVAGGAVSDDSNRDWMEPRMAAQLNALGWEKVAVAFRTPFFSAHNMICALSRDPLTTFLFRKGQGVMDHAAARIARGAAEEDDGYT